MDIAEVAKRSGIPASTLRFYEKKGLISSVGRRGLRRVFNVNILERLALIALGRVAGFSLDEIAVILESKGKLDIDRALLVSKSDELDETIKKLISIRDGLRHAAVCSAPSHVECPKFQRLLGLATSGVINSDAVKKMPQKRRSSTYKPS